MELDIDIPFGELYKQGDVKRILQELYQHVGTRNDAQAWARNLRFLTPTSLQNTDTSEDRRSSDETEDVCVCNSRSPSTFNAIAPGPQGLLHVTKPSQLIDCTHYVAVSWVWRSGVPPHGAVGACEQYVVADEDRECWIPQHVLSRAISFAAHYELSFIWFDKECIDQDTPEDKELGIQAMDIVYQRSLYPLALLQAYIATQRQLDLFCRLVEGVDIPAEDLPALLEVLQLIETDKYFTRTWCLQESTSGGFEMHVLIPHDPSLSKSDILGTLPGEIETSISTLIYAVNFAYACVSLCDESINAALESALYRTIDRILSFVPLVIDQPTSGFDDPEYRQACNAAQALTFLHQRDNHRVADRIAVLGNLCDYRLRLDTNAIEAAGYGFSICAFALAIFNGDLSLSQSDNPVGAGVLDYSWGPQTGLRLSQLEHFEDDNLVVRAAPAALTEDGLLVKGWLWKLEEIKPNIPSSGDPALLIWSFLKYLLRSKYTDLAQVVWRFTKEHRFGASAEKTVRDNTLVPPRLADVLDQDGNLTYQDSEWMRHEDDFRNFLEPTGSGSKDTRTVDQREFDRRWDYSRWFWTRIKNGSIALARHEQETAPSAVFDAPISASSTYVFQPATVLDQQLATTQRRNAPIFWVVDLLSEGGGEGRPKIVKGTGQMCNGYYMIPDGQSPETFVFC